MEERGNRSDILDLVTIPRKEMAGKKRMSDERDGRTTRIGRITGWDTVTEVGQRVWQIKIKSHDIHGITGTDDRESKAGSGNVPMTNRR